MGRVLHDWSLEERRRLLAKPYGALPEGGPPLVYETIIGDERREHAFGLEMSPNMLIETPAGADYTRGEYAGRMRAVALWEKSTEHLLGPDTMLAGIR